MKWDPRNHEHLRPAPSSPSCVADPPRAHPATGAGCAQGGIRTRSRGSPARRWHSSPRRLRAGRLYLPALRLRAASAAHPPWGCAYFGHRDHQDRFIVIAPIGHGDRSEATLVVVATRWWLPPSGGMALSGQAGEHYAGCGRRRRPRSSGPPGGRATWSWGAGWS